MCQEWSRCKATAYPTVVMKGRQGLVLGVHLGFLLLDGIVMDVLIVRHELVDGACRSEFDDTVGYSLDEFMVVRTEENVALE